MIKLNVGNLAGFKLALLSPDGKIVGNIATLADQPYATDDPKERDQARVYHLRTNMSRFAAGEVIAEMPGNRLLTIKAVISSRQSARKMQSAVGSIG